MAKIIEVGLTDEIISGLCDKWGYLSTIMVEQGVEVPDPEKEGATIVVQQKVEVPNPQSKDDFFAERLRFWLASDYKAQLRHKKRTLAEVAAD